MKSLDQVVITLRNQHGNMLPVIIDVYDNSLSRKWLKALNLLLKDEYHLEKNYCFLGFAQSDRTPEYICNQINNSIQAINNSNIGYQIDDHYTVKNTTDQEWNLSQDRMNQLHRYFEELQGTHSKISEYYHKGNAAIKWHIRQLNLLCHEYETLITSIRKLNTAPEWQRPSQLMCWLNAPRFKLDNEDFDLFGINAINRNMGGVYIGVNKAVGKHHWEVFNDEGRDSRLGELTTSTLRGQTLAAGDFDIEWAQDSGSFPWQQQQIADFVDWLKNNNFDPDDKSLTIGHPKIGQVNLLATFGSTDFKSIWKQLDNYTDVFKITTKEAEIVYPYRWSDSDFQEQQIKIILQGH
jgi:hypothetical protein